MERLRALYQHWSWLPHFRAIAETQHLGHAAAMLRITPPALSRALQRLEAALDTKLFDRHGRRLVINSAGTELLAAMRTAMRHIDDAATAVGQTRQPIHVRIAAPGPYFRAVVLPAVTRVRTSWPELRVELVTMPPSVVLGLTSGEADVCLHEHPVASSELVSEAIHGLHKVVACSPAHPAARRRRLRVADLAAYEFVAPPATAEGMRNDSWPVEFERRVGITVADMQLGVDAASTGRYLALLPRPIARSQGLVGLKVSGLTLPATTIFASRRRPLATTSDATTRITTLLRAELARSSRGH